jgi:hypothetical protein
LHTCRPLSDHSGQRTRPRALPHLPLTVSTPFATFPPVAALAARAALAQPGFPDMMAQQQQMMAQQQQMFAAQQQQMAAAMAAAASGQAGPGTNAAFVSSGPGGSRVTVVKDGKVSNYNQPPPAAGGPSNQAVIVSNGQVTTVTDGKVTTAPAPGDGGAFAAGAVSTTTVPPTVPVDPSTVPAAGTGTGGAAVGALVPETVSVAPPAKGGAKPAEAIAIKDGNKLAGSLLPSPTLSSSALAAHASAGAGTLLGVVAAGALLLAAL